MVLPDKPVAPELGPPHSGDAFYWSGSSDEQFAWMTRAVTLPADSFLSAKVRYGLQEDFDYLYVVASHDGFAYDIVPTNLSTDEDPNGLNIAFGITGSSGGEWVDLTADLSAFEGNAWVGFVAVTDGEIFEEGFFIDDVELTGAPLDDAETDVGWSLTGGFSWQRPSFHAYVAEYRQYRGYDETLETGPYLITAQDPGQGLLWTEHFPYQPGLLVTYWDSSQPSLDADPDLEDGRGLMLPVDAHPDAILLGGISRIEWEFQAYDAPFGLDPTDPFLLPVLFGFAPYPSQPAEPIFDDNLDYWREDNPWTARNPHTGTQIRVQSVSSAGFMQVQVSPSN